MKKKFLHFSSNYHYRLQLFISVVSIVFGGIIYILFRPAEPVFFSWICKLGIDNWITPARQNSLFFTHFFPTWFIYSFPSCLWAFAYSILITGIWFHNKSFLKYLWFSTIPLLVIGWEVFQLIGLLRGTFSPGDITMGIAGISAGIFIGIKLTKLNNYEKNSI